MASEKCGICGVELDRFGRGHRLPCLHVPAHARIEELKKESHELFDAGMVHLQTIHALWKKLRASEARERELQGKLEEAEARHRKSDWCRQQNWQEVLSTRSERDAALDQVVELKEELSRLRGEHAPNG